MAEKQKAALDKAAFYIMMVPKKSLPEPDQKAMGFGKKRWNKFKVSSIKC